MADKCTINPNVNNNKGGEVPSPLFEDLKKLCNGNVNQARDIWSKIDNDENRQRISELPEDMREYYPGTNDYSLYMYLMVSDAYKEVDQEQLKNLLLDKYELKNLDANDPESLTKIVNYLNSNWATMFAITYDKFTTLDKFNFKLVEPSKATDKIANEFRFANKLFGELSDVFGALGIGNTALKDMISHFRNTNQRVQWSPIFISSMFVKLLNYFSNMNNPQSIPREIGYILKELSHNNPLYARIRNITDEHYEEYITRDKEDANLTEEELKDIAFCNVIAIAINNKQLFKDLTLNTLVQRYIKDISIPFNKLAHSRLGNKSFKEGLNVKSFVDAIYSADNATSTVLDDNFFTINPELRRRSKDGNMVDKMQGAIEDIIKQTAKLISVERKIESRSKTDTNISEEDNPDALLRRDVLPQLDSMNWNLIKASNSIDEVTLRGALNTALQQCNDLLGFLNNKMEQIKSLNLEEDHALNAEVAENLRDYKISVDYLQQIVNVFQNLRIFENNFIEGAVKSTEDVYKKKEKDRAERLAEIKDENLKKETEQKFERERQTDLIEKKRTINTLKNKRFFADNTNNTITQINDFIPTFKSYYIDALKKILSKELQDVIGNDKIVDRDGKQYTVKEYIDKATTEGIEDLGLDRWFASMAQCNNPILSLIGQYKKIRQEAANQRTQIMVNDLFEAADILKKSRPLGPNRKSTKFMFRKKDGKIIDKYVMDYDIDEFSRQMDEYLQTLQNRTDIPEETKRNLFAKWKEDHTEIREDLGGHRFPKRSDFPSAEYAKFTEAEKKYWATFMALKISCENEFPNMMFSIDNAIVNRKNKWEYLIEHRVTNEKLKKVSVVASPVEALGKMWHDTWHYTSNDIDVDIVEDRDFKNGAIYTLPLYYSRLAADESMDDMSLDTVNSLATYITMFNRSAELSNVLGVLECAADVIEEFNANNSDATGYVTSLLKTEHLTEHYEHVRSRSISFINKVYKSYDERNDIALYKDFLRRQVYGKYQNQMRSKPVRVLVNGYMRFTAIRTMGWKIGTAIANVVQAYINIIPEMARKQHFTFGDFVKAQGRYLRNAFVFPMDLGTPTPRTHATLWSQKFNVLQDFEDNVKNIDYRKSRLQRLFTTDVLFALMHLGEHHIQHLTAYSMAYNKQNELMDSHGTKYNAYNAFYTKTENGVTRLYLREGLSTTIKGKQYEIITNEEIERRKAEFITNHPNEVYKEDKILNDGEMSESAWITQLGQRMLGTNQYMHGIYNKEDSCAAQASVWANLGLMYRRYLYPSLKRRYGKRTYNAQIGSEQEGYYATARRINKMLKWEKNNNEKYKFENLTVDQQNIVVEAMKEEGARYGINNTAFINIAEAFDALPKVTQREILYGTKNVRDAIVSTLNEYEKGNLRAFKSELSTLCAIMLANLAFALFDDDDDDGFLLAELKYQLRRSQTELSSVSIVSSQISIVWCAASLALQNFADINIGFAGGMLAETTQLINSPVVGTNLFENTFGSNPVTDLATIENYSKPYEGKIKTYKGLTKAEVAWKKLFPFVDWEGQTDPQKVTAQKNWYGNIKD